MANLSDIKRRLLERWNDPRYSKAALRRIEIGGGSGIRGLNDFTIDFRYPVTVVAGENGTGKSTILACAACAYHNRDLYTPNDIDPRRPYYTFSDFLIFTPADNPPRDTKVTWHYSGDGYPLTHTAIKKNKWSKYDRRPIRAVQFVGISRALPARERTVLRSHFAKIRPLKGRRYTTEETSQIGHVLGVKYSMAGRAISGGYNLHVTESKARYSGFNMGAGEDSIFELVEIMHLLPEGALLIIEEIETGLHPAAQVRLLEEIHAIAFKRHLQIILTTHSFDVLKNVPKEGRIFLKRYTSGIVPLYGIAPAYAFSLMSDAVLPELTIYVEDDVTRLLIYSCLSLNVRSRCRILEIGSNEALASQLAGARRDTGIGKVLGIYDGETSIEKFAGFFKKQLQRNLSEEDDEWLNEHSIACPGKMPPEAWIIEKLCNPITIKEFSAELNSSEKELMPIIERLSIKDHHDIFFELSKQTGLTIQEVKNSLTKVICRVFLEEFKEIIEKVNRLLQ